MHLLLRMKIESLALLCQLWVCPASHHCRGTQLDTENWHFHCPQECMNASSFSCMSIAQSRLSGVWHLTGLSATESLLHLLQLTVAWNICCLTHSCLTIHLSFLNQCRHFLGAKHSSVLSAHAQRGMGHPKAIKVCLSRI